VKPPIDFAYLIEGFFLERLMSERRVSQHTVASYRDTFRLLFRFIQERFKRAPSELTLDDLSAERITAFLRNLEETHGCSARSRNQRLAAIRSFFHYLAYKIPQKSGQIQQVLAIPSKRHERVLIDFLNHDETKSLLASPDKKSWFGRRDHLLLSFAIQTGLRLSELTALCWSNLTFGRGSHVRVIGKGRKERVVPLSREMSAALASWHNLGKTPAESPVFHTRQGSKLSADAVQRLLGKYVLIAKKRCPSLAKKRISPHVLRHTTAMRLLQSGVGAAIIALWLGHDSLETTNIYFSADLQMKEKTLKKTRPLGTTWTRHRPGDRLLEFLEQL
jgi:site-specific recombinase XerD